MGRIYLPKNGRFLMNCKNCNFDNKEGVDFCGSCGHPLDIEKKDNTGKETFAFIFFLIAFIAIGALITSLF